MLFRAVRQDWDMYCDARRLLWGWSFVRGVLHTEGSVFCPRPPLPPTHEVKKKW